MILTFDAGNTSVAVCGVCRGDVLFKDSVPTGLCHDEDGYLPALTQLFEKNNVLTEKISGTIISSVVPDADNMLKDAAEHLTGKKALVVTSGLKTGITIKGYDEKGLGIDRLVDCVAASRCYGNPAIVYDLGSASTMSIVDAEGAFIGGTISAGVQLGLDVLGDRCGRLPKITAKDAIIPAGSACIGTDTRSCMENGAIIGAAAMIDGMIYRAAREMGYAPEDTTIVLTGGNAQFVYPHLTTKYVICDPDLLPKGLAYIYELNCE